MHIKLIIPSKTIKLNLQELILFSDELALMLNAGLSILSAINTIKHSVQQKQQYQQRLPILCTKLLSALNQGQSIEQAFILTQAFPPMYCALVSSGEKSGNLAQNFAFLATYYQQHLILKHQLQKALAYPCILFCFGILSALLLTFFLVPKLNSTFNLHELPFATTLLITGMLYITEHLVEICSLSCIFSISTILIHNSSSKLQMYSSKLVLQIPYLRDLIYTINLLRYFHVFAITFSAGTQLLLCLKLANQTCTNQYLKQQFKIVTKELKAGSSIYQAFIKINILPGYLSQMIAIGEESGTLDLVLKKASNQLKEKLQRQLQLLGSVLEPIFMLIISAILGFIIYAMYLPILNLKHVF